MHTSSLLRMEWFIKSYLVQDEVNGCRKVLDVGSYDVNGTYRSLFNRSVYDYTGLDMTDGPNVDVVPRNTYAWDEIEDESFDIVVSGQAFEHIEFFWWTMEEMARVLKRNGLLCIIAPRDIARHRFPVDCYRFDADGMVALARYAGLRPLYAATNCAPADAPLEWYSADGDAMLVAKKKADWQGIADKRSYSFKLEDMRELSNGHISKETRMALNVIDRFDLLSNKILYIYGAGMKAEDLANALITARGCPPRGIVVSDGYRTSDEMSISGKCVKIHELSEIDKNNASDIVFFNTVVSAREKIKSILSGIFGDEAYFDEEMNGNA